MEDQLKTAELRLYKKGGKKKRKKKKICFILRPQDTLRGPLSLSLLSFIPPLSLLHSPPHSPIGLINEQVWPLLFSHYDPATLRLIDNSPLVARSSRLHYKSQGQGQSGGLPAAGQSGGNQLRGRHPERGNKARRLGNQGDGEGLCVLDCRLLIMDGGKRGERCSVTRAMLKRVAGGPSSQSALIFG